MTDTVNHPFTGVGVALVTPFKDGGEPDLPAMERLVEHVISGGVDFLVPMGTTGESVTLTEAEIRTVVGVIQETNKQRKPILVGCAGSNTAAVAQRLQTYDKYFKPDGFLTATPAYNKPNQRGLLAHYQALDEATELPMVIYNVPSRTGVNLDASTTLAIANACESVVAIKEASGNIAQGVTIISKKPRGFSVLSGDDDLAAAQVAIGYEGVISVVANALPGPYTRLIQAARTGNRQAVITGQTSLQEVMGLHFTEGNPVGIKAALHHLGICEPHVRLPLVNASGKLQERISAAYQALPSLY